MLNGKQMSFDADVLMLRDSLVMAYKPLQAKIRMLVLNEIDEIPPRAVVNFTRAWTAWESAWLRNREIHAVEALQPLAKAILALEPLLLSHDKERLLPWPRVQHQKAVTLMCLEGFVHALSDLAASMLPSLQRELDHDPRLLLLMEHVLKLRGEADVSTSRLSGLSSAPDVSFPQCGQADEKEEGNPRATESKGMPLNAYAFRLLGSSDGAAGATPAAPEGPHKHSEVHRKAEVHAAELLAAFESVKDMLLSLKSTLEYINPALDKDTALLEQLQRFERAFRRAKRLCMEPDNLV